MFEAYQVTGKKATREGFGAAVHELGQQNDQVVVLSADLSGSLKIQSFIDEFPERFFQVGVAEANMMGIAAGLATVGKIPFTTTFANFSTGRVYDQVRQSIAYSGKNVKLCASHSGLTLGEDGATHQILEDLGLMRMLPGMVVINPCDYNQTRAATLAVEQHYGPTYLRFGRPKWPIFMPKDAPFEIGKAHLMKEGADVSVFATGHMVYNAMKACEQLAEDGIDCELINIHTIKPLDEEAVLESVRKTGCAVTAEEHNRYGGLGDTIAQTLATRHPVPMRYVAVDDRFGESGKPDELLEKYGLSPNHIVQKVKALCEEKVKL